MAMGKDRLLGKKTLHIGGFLDEFEKDDIKRKVDIVLLFEHFGVRLQKKGKSHIGRCPWHDDKTPSLSVDKEKGLYNCFGCGESGDHFTLVMKMKGCDFKSALTFLKGMTGKGDFPLSRTVAKKKETTDTELEQKKESEGTKLKKELPDPAIVQETAQKTKPPDPEKQTQPPNPEITNINLDVICDYYHKKLYENRKAFTYLTETRKINPELSKRFKIGFAAGTLMNIISNGQKEACKALGILKGTDKGRVWEFFTGCLTFPIFDEMGKVVHLYGRKADPKADHPHLYLRGSHKSIFNLKASKVYDTIIIVESILDCLSLITIGFENVQSLYGVGTLPAEHLQILKTDRVKVIILALDNDAAGRDGTEKHKKTFLDNGFNVKVITPSTGKDWNDCLIAGIVKQAIEKLIKEAPLEKPHKDKKSGLSVKKEGQKYIFTIAGITYRILGVKKLFATSLRVNIRAEYDNMRFPDNVDLCSARSRSAYSQILARMFELEVQRIENDLIQIMDYFDEEREKELKYESGEQEEIELSEAEQKQGLMLLQDKNMFDQVAEDMTALGYVNEYINKLIVYIAAMSRLMKNPLNVYIQSGSSGGKSALLSTLEMLILPSDVWKATTISAQAFNYVEQERFLGKVFFMGESIHDEAIEGLVRQMQSEGEISRLVTVKDEKTGEMRAQLIRKKVRMSFMVTSTALHLNQENASRCLILTADESKTQTHKVQQRLGFNHDFEGVVVNPEEMKKIMKKHHAAQVLLENVHVFNPYCKYIQFPTARPSMRRAYEQFLTMIDTICFLRQMQKPDVYRTNPATGKEIRCKTCDLDDYSIAYTLFIEGILKNSGFDIPTGTRKLYETIREMVRDQAVKQHLKVNEVSFIQKQLREYTQLGGEFIKKHVRILVNYEYLEVLGGRRHGTQYAYRLREDRPIEEMDISMITAPDKLKKFTSPDEIF
jgi:DNA primase